MLFHLLTVAIPGAMWSATLNKEHSRDRNWRGRHEKQQTQCVKVTEISSYPEPPGNMYICCSSFNTSISASLRLPRLRSLRQRQQVRSRGERKVPTHYLSKRDIEEHRCRSWRVLDISEGWCRCGWILSGGTFTSREVVHSQSQSRSTNSRSPTNYTYAKVEETSNLRCLW